MSDLSLSAVAESLDGALQSLSSKDRSFPSDCLPLALSCLRLSPLLTSSGDVCNASGSLQHVPLAITTDQQRERWSCRKKALEVVSKLSLSLPTVEALTLWPLYLPGSSLSPYALSLCDLLCSSENKDVDFDLQVCSAVSAFLDHVGALFGFVEKRSATLGFTPLYQSLGESLENAHKLLVRLIHQTGDTSATTGAVRTLATLVKHCPYKKLGYDSLREALDLSLQLAKEPNPVSRIAGLNLHSAVLAADCSSQEVCDFPQSCAMLLSMAFPRSVVDNNVRYVALQNLGQLSSVHPACIAENTQTLTKTVEQIIHDNDDAIVLHTLRVYKMVSKHDPSKSDSTSSSPHRGLWNNLIKPKTFQAIVRRGDSSLQAALCDFISEIGESTFNVLSNEQRMLCISFLVNHCESDSVAVKSSSFRGLGMLLGYPCLQSDTSFLVDCAEKILSALSTPSKSHAVSASWALASLAEALAVLHLSEDSVPEEFPRHYVLRLLVVSPCPKLSGLHMNVKVNLLRASGCLLRCVDDSYVVGGCESDLDQTLDKVLNFIICNIQEDQLMKIRWNACYAGSKILQNSFFTARPDCLDKLLSALLTAIEGCKNFKVKINATSALLSIKKRALLGETFFKFFQALLLEIDRTDNDEDSGAQETKHKMDLIDTILLALAHLISIGDEQDLGRLECQITRDQVDNLRFSLSQVKKRLSPEKSEVLCKAQEKVQQQGRDLQCLSMLLSNV